jgi:hypothetical protein
MATPSIAQEVTRRVSKRDVDDSLVLRSMSGELLVACREALSLTTGIRFPTMQYAQDPVGYVRNVLGYEPWHKQIDILNAVRDHDRVAVKSGHKTGKSTSAAAIALWWYSMPDARAIMSSTTARQVDQILWREVRMQRARSGRCIDCKRKDPEGFFIPTPCEHSAVIDGQCGDLARTGLKSHDFREITGLTAREAEAIAGISGSRLLFLLDEASGIPSLIFEAIEGNRAGGAKIVLFGNPTRNEGEFFDAFHSKSRFYFQITVTSEETPNAISGQIIIPGLATRGYVEEKKEEWGENSAAYLIRVKGDFALNEESRIFSTHAIIEAEKRWHEVSDAGRLYLGVDPAGETGTGDETAISVRRGQKHLALILQSGLTVDQHVSLILKVISDWQLPRETPVVVIDREGKIGSDLHIKLQQYVEEPEHVNAPPFELESVKASGKAQRRPDIYDRARDELTRNLEEWIKSGGGILTDTKLAKEMQQFKYIFGKRGITKVTPKDDIRKLIGRSPDRYDSLALACWEPRSLAGAQEEHDGAPAVLPRNGRNRPVNDNGEEIDETQAVFDPYEASKAFQR